MLFVFLSCGPEYYMDTYEDKNEYRQAIMRAHRKALKDSTVLASFKGGPITRSDMVRYGARVYGLRSVVGSVNRVDCLLSSVKKQRLLLREMVEKQIFLQEAKRRGFDTIPEIKQMLQDIDHKALIPIHYQEVIAKQLTFREPAVYIQHLLLRFPRTISSPGSAALPARAASVRNQALKLRQKALSGTLFSSLVKRYSSDYTKARNGHLGWIVASSMGKRYWEAVVRLPLSRVSAPIVVENGVYLARVLKRRTLTERDFRKYLHDRFTSQLQEKMLKAGKRRFIDRLLRSSGVVLNETLLSGGKPEAVLARVGGWTLTLQEYESRFSAFSKGHKINTFSTRKRLKWRKRFLKEYLIAPRLIVRDALRRGLDKTAAYKKALHNTRAIKERVLYIEMKDHLFRTGLGDVSVERVRKIYNKYRKERYYSRRAVTPAQAKKHPEDMIVRQEGRIFLKVLQPFESVQARATRRIVRELRYRWIDAFIKRKFKEIGFSYAPLKDFSAVYYSGKR